MRPFLPPLPLLLAPWELPWKGNPISDLCLGKRLTGAPGEARLLPLEWKPDDLYKALLAHSWSWRILSWGQPPSRLRLPRTALIYQVLGSAAMAVRRVFNPLPHPSPNLSVWRQLVSCYKEVMSDSHFAPCFLNPHLPARQVSSLYQSPTNSPALEELKVEENCVNVFKRPLIICGSQAWTCGTSLGITVFILSVVSSTFQSWWNILFELLLHQISKGFCISILTESVSNYHLSQSLLHQEFCADGKALEVSELIFTCCTHQHFFHTFSSWKGISFYLLAALASSKGTKIFLQRAIS